METMLWVLFGIAVNMAVGAGVWSAIDSKDQQLYRWYKDCPPQIAWFAQPLVLTAWPLGLWLMHRHKAKT